MSRIKYIDLLHGEMRVGFEGERLVSLSGGPKDPVRRKFVAIDALRKRIGELNRRLDDAIDATTALDSWEPK